MPQANVIHIDQALTEFSQMYTNEDYVAASVMPPVPVKKRSDKWFVYGKEHLRVKNLKLAPGAVATELNYSLSTSTFYAERRAERHFIPDDNLMMEDEPLNEEIDATEFLAESMLLEYENAVASFVTNTSNLTNNAALSGGSKWSDYVNSTPLTDIKTAKASVKTNALKRANAFVIPYEPALVLADHPSIKDLIKYTDPKSLNESGLPPVVRGLRVIEPGSMADGANEGRAASLSAVWAKNAIIAYINPTPRLKSISLGYTFLAPDPTSGTRGLTTRTYRMDDRKGEFVETEQTYDLRIVAAGAGYLYQTVIA